MAGTRGLPVVVLAFALACGIFAADAPKADGFEFRDYTWDTNRSEVFKDKSVMEVLDKGTAPDSGYSDRHGMQDDRIAGVKCSVSYYFDRQDRLKLIALDFFGATEAKADALKALYTKKFGSPYKTEGTEDKEDKNGKEDKESKDGKDGIVTLRWRSGDTEISMQVYEPVKARPNYYIHVVYARPETEAEKQEAQDNAEKDADKI